MSNLSTQITEAVMEFIRQSGQQVSLTETIEAVIRNNPILIEVQGGVAWVGECPDDIKVKIIDYDLDDPYDE